MTSPTRTIEDPARRVGPLTIGVIGPLALVEQVMRMGRDATGPVTSRIQGAAYRNEREAPDKVSRLGDGVDVYLFAGPVPYEYARRAGVLDRPATHIALDGSSLHEALLRAAVNGQLGDGRLSIDMLTPADVREVYAEAGLRVDGMHLHEPLADVSTLTGFHVRLWQRRSTSAALTCVRAVASRLDAAGVPVVHIRPTGAATRAALRAAEMLGERQRLEAAQLAVAVIDVPALCEPATRRAPRYWREGLKLGVQRVLVQEAHRMNAAAWPIEDQAFLVAATHGSFAAATDGFRVRPFVDRVHAELGVEIRVGIGVGRTTQAAETHARAALTAARGFAVAREGHALVPADRAPRQGPRQEPMPSRAKAMEILARLAEGLDETGDPPAVDAVGAADLLGVTRRTARRHLRTLVDEGLAWPLPPSQTHRPGRPAHLLRLNTDMLTTTGGASTYA